MKKYYVLFVLPILSFLTACNSYEKQNIQLLHGLWTITDIDGVSVVDDTIPLEFDINIEKLQFSGNAGCNTINGTLTIDTTKTNNIVFSTTAISKMMCPDMVNETHLIGVLEQITNFRIDTTTTPLSTEFFNKCNDIVLKLSFLKDREATEWSVNGRWTIKSVNGIPTDGTESGTELIFDLSNNSISGYVGCNSINGGMLFSDDAISFSDVCYTELYCDENTMKIEETILSVLGYVSQWTVQNGELILSDASEKNIINLIRE